MRGSHYSPELRRDMVWLSGLVTYAQASAIFERIGQQQVSPSSLWRESQSFGERLDEAQRVAPAPEPVCESADERPKGLSMDGGMVNVRREGWKEVKVGSIFAIEVRPEPDSQTDELRPQATDLHYCASLGQVREFETRVDSLAHQHGIPDRPLSLSIADGADWIWKLVARLFPESQQVVDWYHALEHLLPAAEAYAKQNGYDLEAVRENWIQALFEGWIDLILQTLQDAGLTQYCHYFQVHRERMQYAAFRQRGLPIGSGNIESGVKQFKARLAGPGMRWSRTGAEHMLAIRAAVLSNRFDHLWDAA